jgi:hypothetical protein
VGKKHKTRETEKLEQEAQKRVAEVLASDDRGA